MKNLQHFIFACALWACAWYALIQPVTWISNVFAFFTWAVFVLMILSTLESKAIIKSYQDGKHAPEWFDHLTYLPVIVMCAAMGHYGKAFAWSITYIFDLNNRHRALKKS